MHAEMRSIAEKVKDAEQDRLMQMEADKVAMMKKLKDVEDNKANQVVEPIYYLNKR